MNKNENEVFTTTSMKKQEIIRNLRDKKFRITNQRMMLLDIILEGDCTCCKEIYYKALKKDSKIGIATVYRIVHTLESIGALNRKRLYQIEYNFSNEIIDTYRVVLDDHTEIHLSDHILQQVVASGLKCCGLLKNQSLKSIEMVRTSDSSYVSY